MTPPTLSRRLLLAVPLAAASLTGRPSPLRAQSGPMPPLGDPAAPVTVIEYASMTCPHCATFHNEVLPEFEKRYISTGKVKLEFRDFPLDQLALRAAQLAHCAGPGRYHAFLDVFFAQQASWARASDPIAALKQLSRLGGLGAEAADRCLADKALEDSILKTRLDAQSQFNVSSTPSFVIDGKTVSGEQSIEDFAALIDPLLE